MFENNIDDLHQNQSDSTKQEHFEKPLLDSHSISDRKVNDCSPNDTSLRSRNGKEKITLSISKQLSSHRTKPQAKVTIVGTDRTTFASALTMALRRHVSEIVIFDEMYNRQMKISFHDVSRQHYFIILPCISYDSLPVLYNFVHFLVQSISYIPPMSPIHLDRMLYSSQKRTMIFQM
jgi:hypothetical protein